MTMMVPYPFWPKAVSPNISPEHPVVSDLEAIAFPWTSPVERSKHLPGTVEFEVLARSSGRSWTVPPETSLDPQSSLEPPPEQARDVAAGRAPGHPLIVSLTGGFNSAFRGKPVLRPDGTEDPRTHSGQRLDESAPTQMIVIGNSRMFTDQLVGQAPSTPILFLNAIDWLTHGRRLIDVRSKSVTERPLGEIDETTRLLARSLGIFAVPLVVVVTGVVRSWMRGRRSGRPHPRRRRRAGT
jgi:ABC-type uncharacterized transport system involved in gliding motility auxiliary subunit